MKHPTQKLQSNTTALLMRSARGHDTLRDFAALLHVSVEQVRKYESGENEPDDTRCEKWGLSRRSAVVSQLGRFILEQRAMKLAVRLSRINAKQNKVVTQ